MKGKSIDKGERQLVTSQMAGDIMVVYEQLGGAEWLLKFAKANPKEFIQQGLSRLFPAPQRGDDPDVQVNVQTNVVTDFEAAQRIAFVLAKAAYEQEQLPPAIEAVRVTSARATPEPAPPVAQPEMSPQEACRWGALDRPNPSPESEGLDPARKRWVEELPLTPEERADNALTRETRECSLETYRGSSAEQCDAPRRPSSCQPSPGERCRALSRRGRDLL
ncbi:hypothetical protein N5D53_10945 [Pseudomonas sp. GD03862]|uniref:hypothetical protein n=1 Tax=Pseudomonas sp. GD03862 TaxID=2975391 RepID=UPI00244D21A1|nr:hypothetical protein [Pseudomonas sp. GD03862]MDH0707033.1 hypothetical protein [Pseudomonas sp. GD03862]